MDASPPISPCKAPPPASPAPTVQPAASTVATAPASASPSAPANPPRLVIDRLVLQNFKSYGGVVHVGPFHTSFSSIVGPNGSGKSNVIDAMLFVFGRRAKALRHNKLSELLHHSTAYPNVDSASVTVYFSEIVDGANDGDFERVEGSQFAVCRRAFRNNTSKYFIDAKEVKMNQVVALLKSKAVDLDNNRFLILQGEVEQIAMMKPKGVAVGDDGLLEYLEDIIGSARFVERIEASGKKVEDLNEERGHKLNRVKAAERERNGLEGAKLEAEDYLDKERVLLGKKLALCRATLVEKLDRLLLNTKDMIEKEKEYDEFRNEMKGKDEELKELETVFKETQKNAEIAVKTMNKAKDEYTAFERKDIKLREDIKAFKARLKKLDDVKSSEQKRVEESKKKVQAFEEEKNETNERLKELETELQTLEKDLVKVRDHVREKTAGVRQELEAKQTEKLPFSEKVNEARKQLDVTQSELKLVLEKLEAPEKALREAEEGLSKMEEAGENARDSVLKLEAEERELNEKIAVLKQEQAEGETLQSELSTAVSRLRRQVEEARAAREDVHTRSRLHNGILSASRNGVLHGVVGRLGDLASVDAKFAAAVGAAAGSNLDCIVVKTAENAQACIQFLRRENLGRATFVILEKIEYLRQGMQDWERSGRSADGPRLFDYLRIPKPEHRTAVYYALRDTLVADSLESARRMAFKPTRQNRVVSLAGELIESSGAMSGGGRGPSRYRLGSGSGGEAPLDPAELQRLEEKYEDSRRQASELQAQLREIDDKIRRYYSRLEELQVLIGKARMESESLTSRIAYMRDQTLPALMKTVKHANKAVKNKSCEDTRQRIELEKKVAVGERNLREAQKSCEALESEIGALQERIVAMGGSRLQEATDAVGECRAEISESQSVVSRATSRAAAAGKAGRKAEGAVKAAEAEMETTTKKIEEAKEMSESMLDDAEKVLEKFKETEEVHKEWEEKLGEVQKEYSEVKGRLKELRRKELSLSEAVQNVKAFVMRDKIEVGNLKNQEKKFVGKMKKTSLASVASVVEEEEDEEDSMEVEEEDEGDGNQGDAVEDEEGGGEGEGGGEEDGNGTEYEEYKLSAQEHKQLTMEVGVLESELSKLTPDLNAIAEYKSKDEEYRGQVNELDALTQMRDTARRECDGLRKARLDEFMSGFSVITLKLKELYQMITLGGDAELELVDSLDPFSEGIVFSVRPPKKSWKNISNLSGGEKTLSSLALVFALHHFKPTPLYFLDEIDAALDYKNVSIVANYVKERTKNAQFIIISLRNNMFELADRLVGIYKTYNVTKSVSIDPAAFVMPQTVVEQEDVAA